MSLPGAGAALRPGPEVAVLDDAYLQSIQEVAQEQFPALMQELLDAFDEDFAARMGAWNEAFDQRDTEAVAAAMHHLRGGTGNLGFPRVMALAEAVRVASREGAMPSREAFRRALDAELATARAALRVRLG